MQDLVIDTISDSHKFGQTNNWKFQMAVSGIKRKAILARLPIISSFVPLSYLTYVGKKLPVNGLLAHGGGPIHPGGTIEEDKCCLHPLQLDPDDPDFIKKTSGGLNMISDDEFEPAYPDKIIISYKCFPRLFRLLNRP